MIVQYFVQLIISENLEETKMRKLFQLKRGNKKPVAWSSARLWTISIIILFLTLLFPLRLAFAVNEDDLFEIGEPWYSPVTGSANILNDSNNTVLVIIDI